MECYRVALFGHRDLSRYEVVERRLSSVLDEVIREKAFVEILIGRNGEFDIFAASVVKRLQKRLGRESSALILVLPYTVRDVEYYENYYDEIIIPEQSRRTHPKAAIGRRNRWMVMNCDMVICFVERDFGGAREALRLACSLGKKTVNLAEDVGDFFKE